MACWLAAPWDREGRGLTDKEATTGAGAGAGAGGSTSRAGWLTGLGLGSGANRALWPAGSGVSVMGRGWPKAGWL